MADELRRMEGYTASDISDNIAEVREARGTYDSLGEHIDAKQDKIDASHKLDPALVDFSAAQQAALDSGVTAEDVEQIETNKTNILSVADRSTMYNIVPIKSTIPTGNASVTATVAADKSITIEITGTTSTAIGFEISDNFSVDTSAQYVMTGNPSAGAIRLILQQAESPYNWIGQQYNNQAAAVSPNVSLVRYYVYIYANSSGTITIKPMLTPKTLWDKGFTDYQPYAMSDVELTKDVLLLTRYEQIPNNTNLNTLTTLGKRYQCKSAAIAATLSNCPTTDGFMLYIKETASVQRFLQEIIPNKENEIYRRWYTSQGFSSWYKFSGTVVS